MNVQIDLTQIILAILGIIATVVTAYVIPLLKNKIGDDNWKQFINIVTVAVSAAEQLGITGTIEDKMDYAMQQAKIAMLKRGLKYDDETIKAAIEALVLQLKETSTTRIQLEG